MKHTIGPWYIEKHIDKNQKVYKIIVSNIREMPMKNGTVEETVFEINDGVMPNSSDLNLIAAAPEMLQALELILNDNRLMNAMSKEQAKAIMYSVSKAKGE